MIPCHGRQDQTHRLAHRVATVPGDDLHCHQLFRGQVPAQGREFVFFCLPGSHTLLCEWVADLKRTGELATSMKTRWTGKHHLAYLTASLTLLAFLAHTLFNLYDPRYRHVRDNLPSRRPFVNDLRALTLFYWLGTRVYLLDTMIEALQPARAPSSRRSCKQAADI
jgi:hypothetical protein